MTHESFQCYFTELQTTISEQFAYRQPKTNAKLLLDYSEHIHKTMLKSLQKIELKDKFILVEKS